MTTRAYRFPAQAQTPVAIDSGQAGLLETIEAHNPSEAAGAYVKIYASATAPTAGSLPIWSARVPPGAVGSGGTARTLPVFLEGADLWIAVATTAGAGLTAPATPFEISLTFDRA